MQWSSVTSSSVGWAHKELGSALPFAMSTISLLETPAFLAERCLDVTLIGGVARSGTTKIASILQDTPSLICFEECPILKLPPCSWTLTDLRRIFQLEIELWSDDASRSYRGFDAAEIDRRTRFQFYSLLASSSPDRPVPRSELHGLRRALCKTPSCEFCVLELVNALPCFQWSYIHCVRHPWNCVQSNWRMPWTSEESPELYAEAFVHALDQSRRAFREIQQRIPCLVVRAEDVFGDHGPICQARTREMLLQFCGVPESEISPVQQNDVVDHWPESRRSSSKPPFPEALRTSIFDDPRVLDWCSEFGYVVDHLVT